MNGPNDPAEGAFHYGSLVVDLALVVLVGWAVWWVVRYLRADAMTRQSIRQAVRVRWGWPCPACPLALPAWKFPVGPGNRMKPCWC